MNKKVALTAAALMLTLGLSGCATTQSVTDAQAAADRAQSTADGAASAASAAQSSADDAKRMAANAQNTANSAAQAASAAQSCCNANAEKMERMFRKSTSK